MNDTAQPTEPEKSTSLTNHKGKRLRRLVLIPATLLLLYFALPYVMIGFLEYDKSKKPDFREYVQTHPFEEGEFLALFGPDEIWTSRGSDFTMGLGPGEEGTEIGTAEFQCKFSHGEQLLCDITIGFQIVMRIHAVASEHDERFGSDGPLSIDPEGIRISMKWGDWDEDFHPVVVVSPTIESIQSYSSNTAPSDDDHWGDIAVWVYLLSGEGDLVFLVHDDSLAFADHFPYQVEDEIGRLQSQKYADELGIELGPASGLAHNTSTPVGPIDPGSLETLFGLLPDNFMSPTPESGLAYGIGGGIGCGYYKRYSTRNDGGPSGGVVSSGMCNGDKGFALNTTEYSYALEYEMKTSWEVGERSIGGSFTGTGHTKKYLNMNGVTW